MELFVRLPDDSTLPATLSPKSSIATLKSCIQLSAGIPIPLQQLAVQGKKLRDQEKVADCAQEVTVQISPLPEFLLRLIVRETSEVTYQVSVCGDDTAWTVKKRIQELRGIEAPQQRLYSDKNPIEDYQTASDVYRPGNFLWELLQPSEFYCSVATSTGGCYQVSAAPSHRVNRIINKLRQFEGFDCRYQTIKCEGKEVNCADLLSDLKTSDTITLMCEAPSFWLWLTTLNVPSRRIEINPVEPILPRVPLQSTQPQCSSMWILHRGKVLSPTATPSESGLASGAIIEYGDLLVHIRSFNIEKLDLALFSYSHIATLKREVQRRLGRNTFKLMYCGSELNENRTFKDCGFTSEVTIEMIELTDNYSWVESEYDKVAMACNVEDAVREFNRKTGNHDSFNMKILNRKDLGPLLKIGGMLQLYKNESKLAVFVEVQDTTLHRIMNKTDTLGKLLIQLRPIISIIGFENTDNSDLIESIGTKPLRAIIDNRKFIEFRFADGETEILPFDPSESVLELKRRLKNYSEDVEFAFNDTLLDNDKRIGEYYIEETEYVEVCRRTEVIVWTHHTNERLFVPLPSFDQTLSDLHAMCHRLLPEPLLLFSNGFLPDNSETLSSRGIGPGCCIHMIPNSHFTSVIETSPDPDKFIFISLCKGDVFLLSFNHRSTLAGITTPLRQQFTVSFSLILEDHLLTNYRFSRIQSGTTVQLFTPSDGVLFHINSGIVSPALTCPTATLCKAMEMCNIPPSYNLYNGQTRITQERQTFQVSSFSVIQSVCSDGKVWALNTSQNESTYINLPSKSAPARVLIAAIQVAENSRFSPRVYLKGKVCGEAETLYFRETYSVLFPPQLLINAVSPARKEHLVPALETYTVRKLEAAIAQECNLRHLNIRLLHKAELLCDGRRSLSTIDFSTDNSVTVLLASDVVIVLSGSSTSVHVLNCKKRISELKTAYFRLQREMVKNSKLIHCGRILDDRELAENFYPISTFQVMTELETLIKVRTTEGNYCDKIVKTASLSITLLQSIDSAVAGSPYRYHWFGEFEHSRSLSDYKLQNGAILYLLEKLDQDSDKLRLYATSRDNGKLQCITTDRLSTIRTVKNQFLALSDSVPVAIALAGGIAEDEMCLMECEASDGEIVTVVTDSTLLIAVEYEFSREVFTAARSSTGQEVKVLISEEMNVPWEMQQLYCEGRVFEDDMKAEEMAAGRVTLSVELRLRQSFISIQTVNGPFALEVTSTVLTAAEVKSKIESRRFMESSRLFANDRELRDTDSIATRELAYRPLALLTDAEVHICVKSPLSTYELYVKKAESILTVLRKMQRKVGLHYSRLQLVGSVEVTKAADVTLIKRSKSPVLAFTAEAPRTERV